MPKPEPERKELGTKSLPAKHNFPKMLSKNGFQPNKIFHSGAWGRALAEVGNMHSDAPWSASLLDTLHADKQASYYSQASKAVTQ